MKITRIIIHIWLLTLIIMMSIGCSKNMVTRVEPLSNEKVIQNYLDNNVWSPSFENGKIFTSHKLLGQDANHIYLWVYMREFNGYQEGILPLVLNVSREKNSFQIVNHQIPRDGAFNRPDILDLFPKELQDQALTHPNKDELARMRKEAELRADEWFQKN